MGLAAKPDDPIRDWARFSQDLPINAGRFPPWAGRVSVPHGPVCTPPLPHGIEAPQVATVNDANREFGGVTSMTRRAPDPGNRESLGSGGSMVAKLKLKGIDGRAPPGVEPAA